jgi:RNA polymerase sigma-70 factor (ECF subfamily)
MRPVRADADDAVSRSMMVAREKLPGYAKEIIDLEAWLTRLTSNVCLDIKKERWRATRRVDSLDAHDLDHSRRTLRTPQTPEESCLASQVRESIRRALQELSPGLSAVAELRFVQEASYPAIAERLRITQAAARKRVQKARRFLRQHLAGVLTLTAPRE